MSIEAPKPPRKNYSDLVAAYAPSLHAAAGEQHHVVSPLGAWLLLALAAPLTTGGDREALERILGCDVETAARAAGEMLAAPHPALSVALAMWHREGLGEALEAWGRTLPTGATTGPVPSQAEADAWVREHTRGMIESVPATIDKRTRMLIATAAATEAPWRRALTLVPASELGGPWASRVKRVMRTTDPERAQVVARTQAAGLVGVSHQSSRSGLDVVSVIAAPGVPPARVIAAAYEVAACSAGLPSTAEFVPAFELPLQGPVWTVRERVIQDAESDDPIERSQITIPAWSARTELHDLIGAPGTGFAQIANAMLTLLAPDPSGDEACAAQSIQGRFDTNGFSAAQFTFFILRTARASFATRQAIERTVEIRFDRPFAVVAALSRSEIALSGAAHWLGLPAFSAWVTEPMEPSEPKEHGRERYAW
jgi:hypothetical protein